MVILVPFGYCKGVTMSSVMLVLLTKTVVEFWPVVELEDEDDATGVIWTVAVVKFVVFAVTVIDDIFVEFPPTLLAIVRVSFILNVPYPNTLTIWVLMKLSLTRMKGLGFLKYTIPNTDVLSN